MIYCFDTYYFDNKAQTSCIGISDWSSNEVQFELSETISGVQEYESGSFYKRELPCLISILNLIELNPEIDTIVIDGFVILDDDGKLGLGGYLFDHLNSLIPVIGVAKNNFAKINKLAKKVYRGESKKPLYITAKGIDLELASDRINQMHGNYRLPTILKLVDNHCRKL
ncbi:endonuclease V [Tenacibaculum geojense]|uniref:Endonuclease V n=1 Tax=Tenacibaculum geojense TaxID=915352 RepID=A0ABW3JR66_9FLAO